MQYVDVISIAASNDVLHHGRPLDIVLLETDLHQAYYSFQIESAYFLRVAEQSRFLSLRAIACSLYEFQPFQLHLLVRIARWMGYLGLFRWFEDTSVL